MKKTKALIIFNMCPETISLYVVDYEEWMDKANGTYINLDENHATERLYKLLDGKVPIFKDDNKGPSKAIDFAGKVIVIGFML